MSRRSYNDGPCRVCGKLITNAGFARAAHYRKHVREGRMVKMMRWSLTRDSWLESWYVTPAEVRRYKARGWWRVKP